MPSQMARPRPGQPEPPFDRRTGMLGVNRAFMASKAMQQAFGLRGVEAPATPFVVPPMVPVDLVEKFEQGMAEYGFNREVDDGGVGSDGGAGQIDGGDDGTVAAYTVQDPRIPLGMSLEEPVTSRLTLREALQLGLDISPLFEDPIIARAFPRPGISPAGLEGQNGGLLSSPSLPSLPRLPPLPTLWQARTLSISSSSSGQRGSSFGSSQPDSRSSSGASSQTGISSVDGGWRTPSESSLEEGIHMAERDRTSSSSASSTYESASKLRKSLSRLILSKKFPTSDSTASTSTSTCISQMPGLPHSRKRVSTADSQEAAKSCAPGNHHVVKKRLGSVPVTDENAAPRPAFPPLPARPRRPGLTDITPKPSFNLLSWHTTMTALYKQLPSAALFKVHPAFPYELSPPVHIPLVSLSFWDTTCTPHKEILFFGPGDMEVMCYNEVDTFAKIAGLQQEYRLKNPHIQPGFSAAPEVGSARKHMQNRESTGEGRWCFVVLKKKASPASCLPADFARGCSLEHMESGDASQEENHVAPYIFLAFPASAVTKSTECFHTIYPSYSSAEAYHDAGPLSPPSRSITSPSALGFADLPTIPESPEARKPWPLRRTILWFERAGRKPLIECHGTSGMVWDPFVAALGKGAAKVVLFCEPELNIKA